MKKIIPVVIALLIIGLVVAFIAIPSLRHLIYESPLEKVNALKQQNVVLMETSGYNECMKEVADQDAKIKKCISDKMAAKGYTDTVNCFQDYNTNPICKNTDRYNAEVNADNDCNGVNSPNPSPTPTLSEFDCMKLLNGK